MIIWFCRTANNIIDIKILTFIRIYLLFWCNFFTLFEYNLMSYIDLKMALTAKTCDQVYILKLYLRVLHNLRMANPN